MNLNPKYLWYQFWDYVWYLTHQSDYRVERHPADLRDEIIKRSYVLENNPDTVIYNVHAAIACMGRPCPVHNLTNHHMRDFPQHWREDRGIMERICTHGVGHPDPDQFEFWRITKRMGEAVHGCDGCCTKRTAVVV